MPNPWTQDQIETLGNHIIAAEEGNAHSIRLMNSFTRALKRSNAAAHKVSDDREARDKLARMKRARKMPYNPADIIERT